MYMKLASTFDAPAGPLQTRLKTTKAGKRWRPFLTACAYLALRDDPVQPTTQDRGDPVLLAIAGGISRREAGDDPDSTRPSARPKGLDRIAEFLKKLG